MERQVVWVSWQGSTRSHAAVSGVAPADVRNGDFPVECGRFAPSGFDAGGDGVYTGPAANVKPRCARCERKVQS